MGDSFWRQIEFATVEEDAEAVVSEDTEDAGLGFDRLNSAVQPLAYRIRHAVTEVRQDALQMTLEHPRRFHDRLQPTARRPVVPAVEKLLCIADVTIFLEPVKLLLEPGYEQTARRNFERYIQIGALLCAKSVGSNPGAVLRDQFDYKPQGSNNSPDSHR